MTAAEELIQEGRIEARQAIALNGIQEGLDYVLIAKLTGLNLEKISQLAEIEHS